MIVTILGSCANQTATREATSLLVEDPEEGNIILVDTGPGIVAALERCGRRASDVSTVLLTHSHADHVAGFAYFVWQRHFERIGMPASAGALRVLGLEDVLGFAQESVARCYGEGSFPFRIAYEPILSTIDSRAVNVGRMVLTACRTHHTTPSIGVRVQCGSESVSISADTLPVESFGVLSEGADIMFHEGMWPEEYRALADKAMHSTARDAGAVARKAKVRQLVLLHIFPKCIGREGELVREAAEEYKGPISVPCDGTVYVVQAPWAQGGK